jgi:short-subunit dehydrogenase
MNANNFSSSKTALITGASSGIGYELAQVFARHKYNLVLVARNEEKLKDIANKFQEKFDILIKIIVKDLTLPDAPTKIFQELQQERINIDVLVNNAGFATYGFFWETDLKAEMQMMQLNMVALTHLSKLFLKEMVARQQGKILNIASTAAFQPGPLMAVYYATKAYVLSFSEALANELIGTGVTITALCPGPTESGFQARANMERSKLVSGKKIMDAKTVAEIGYRSLMNNQTVVIPGLKNQLLALSIRFTPRNLVSKIVRSMQKKV